jgi:hypothetical protein
MKNVVECYKEFFGYFNALETNGEVVLEILLVCRFYFLSIKEFVQQNFVNVVYEQPYSKQWTALSMHIVNSPSKRAPIL